jgi:hypothetical protein
MSEAAESTDAVAREFARALHQIAGLGDADESWQAATRLGELAGQALEDTARLRAAVALRIYQDEGLSLGQLGHRLGVSKARAADLVSQARKHAQAPAPAPVQLAVQIPGETGARLSAAADATGHSPEHLVDQALRAYLPDPGSAAGPTGSPA